MKDAQRSRRQSIWAVYTSLRHTAKYTGFGCILQVYSRLSSSRLACHAIQRIQRIQRIQPYSHTRHTSYSAIQPPSVNTYVRTYVPTDATPPGSSAQLGPLTSHPEPDGARCVRLRQVDTKCHPKNVIVSRVRTVRPGLSDSLSLSEGNGSSASRT